MSAEYLTPPQLETSFRTPRRSEAVETDGRTILDTRRIAALRLQKLRERLRAQDPGARLADLGPPPRSILALFE